MIKEFRTGPNDWQAPSQIKHLQAENEQLQAKNARLIEELEFTKSIINTCYGAMEKYKSEFMGRPNGYQE